MAARCRSTRACRCGCWCRRCSATRASCGSTGSTLALKRLTATGKYGVTMSTPTSTNATDSSGREPAEPAGPPDGRVLRFNRTERSVHWLHGGAFVFALGSGLALYFPAMEELIGHRFVLRVIHISAGMLFALAPL